MIIAIDTQTSILSSLLLVQSVTAAVMPVLPGVVYYSLSLPLINHLDELMKLAKFLKRGGVAVG